MFIYIKLYINKLNMDKWPDLEQQSVVHIIADDDIRPPLLRRQGSSSLRRRLWESSFFFENYEKWDNTTSYTNAFKMYTHRVCGGEYQCKSLTKVCVCVWWNVFIRTGQRVGTVLCIYKLTIFFWI